MSDDEHIVILEALRGIQRTMLAVLFMATSACGWALIALLVLALGCAPAPEQGMGDEQRAYQRAFDDGQSTGQFDGSWSDGYRDGLAKCYGHEAKQPPGVGMKSAVPPPTPELRCVGDEPPVRVSPLCLVGSCSPPDACARIAEKAKSCPAGTILNGVTEICVPRESVWRCPVVVADSEFNK